MRHYKVSGKSIVFRTEEPCSANQEQVTLANGEILVEGNFAEYEADNKVIMAMRQAAEAER